MAHTSYSSSTGTGSVPQQPQIELSIHQFNDPTFDPVDFINDHLPPLALSNSHSHTSRIPNSVALAELSSRSQSLVSQLSTQNVRFSGNLTQLTEEILRSGGRLAYEVEVLRGEAISLSDSLAESLHEDINKFAPEEEEDGQSKEEAAESADLPKDSATSKLANEPEFIAQLRILGRVRARLEEVIQTFGDAMEWPLPPSELSITSSFISVSAPELGTESHSREERGQEVARRIRAEITGLLDRSGDGDSGVAAAIDRLEQLRNLATIWRGTAEEKARNRFLDGLARVIDDRRKTLDNQRDRSSKKARSSTEQAGEDRDSGSGGGLFRNLQRIRDEIYLE